MMLVATHLYFGVVVTPSQPMGPLLICDVTQDSVCLFWNGPLEDGGGRLTAYIVEAKEMTVGEEEQDQEMLKQRSRFPPDRTTCVVPGLRTGRIFQFRVYAENAAGISHEFLTHKKPVRVKVNVEKPDPPGRPVVEFDAVDESVMLRWAPPANTGGAAIKNYIVERHDMLSEHWINVVEVCSNSLVVTSLIPGLEYEFRVSAENVAGTGKPSCASEPVIVKAKSGSTPPVFTVSIADCTAAEGKEACFEVMVSGNPSPDVTWYRNGSELWDGRRTKISQEGSRSILTFPITKIEDEGEIQCVATNRAGTNSCVAKLYVAAPPRITLPTRYKDGLIFDQAETIRLKFPVCGHPIPTVKWTVNGQEVAHSSSSSPDSDDQRRQATLEDGTLVLVVTEARRVDAGNYEIVASNCSGEDRVMLKVTVTDVPDPPPWLRCREAFGSCCTLEWEEPLNDGGSDVAKYIVEQKNVAEEEWRQVQTSRIPSVTISDLDAESAEAFFRIRAVNVYGASEPSQELRVGLRPPPTTVKKNCPDRDPGEEDCCAKPQLRSKSESPQDCSVAAELLLLLQADLDEEQEEISSDFSDDRRDCQRQMLAPFDRHIAEVTIKMPRTGDMLRQDPDPVDCPDDTMLTSHENCYSGCVESRSPRLVLKPKSEGGIGIRSNTPFRRPLKERAYTGGTFSFWDLGTEVEFRRRYKVCEKIGRGAFTVVHRCYNKKTRQVFAARFIRIGRDLGTREMVYRELEIMSLCRHERIVDFFEAYDLGSYIVMVLEYIPSGELSDRILREDPRMMEEDCRQITRQICEGIAYMHRNQMVHLDLKPENILCMSNNSNNVKLIDFGLARRLDRDPAVRLLFATPEFCAPEVVNYDTVTYATDMWSVGVIAFVMLSASSPFLGDDDNETLANVSDATWDFQEECWDKVSYEAKNFISCLLKKSKDQRMTVEEALRHPWLQGTSTLLMPEGPTQPQNMVRHRQRQEADFYTGSPNKGLCWSH